MFKKIASEDSLLLNLRSGCTSLYPETPASLNLEEQDFRSSYRATFIILSSATSQFKTLLNDPSLNNLIYLSIAAHLDEVDGLLSIRQAGQPTEYQEASVLMHQVVWLISRHPRVVQVLAARDRRSIR